MNPIKWFSDWNNRRNFKKTFDIDWDANTGLLSWAIRDTVYELIDDYQQAERELAEFPNWEKSQAKIVVTTKDAQLRQAIKLARARGFQIFLDEDKTRIMSLTPPQD